MQKRQLLSVEPAAQKACHFCKFKLQVALRFGYSYRTFKKLESQRLITPAAKVKTNPHRVVAATYAFLVGLIMISRRAPVRRRPDVQMPSTGVIVTILQEVNHGLIPYDRGHLMQCMTEVSLPSRLFE